MAVPQSCQTTNRMMMAPRFRIQVKTVAHPECVRLASALAVPASWASASAGSSRTGGTFGNFCVSEVPTTVVACGSGRSRVTDPTAEVAGTTGAVKGFAEGATGSTCALLGSTATVAGSTG